MAPMQSTSSFVAGRVDRTRTPERRGHGSRDTDELPVVPSVRGPLIAVLFHRFGPYHVARLNCAAKWCRLHGVELSRADRTYAWAPTGGRESFPRHVISDDVDAESAAGLVRRIDEVLSAIGPDVVAIAGWSHRGALAALLWSQRRGVPAVLMTESTAFDATRRRWKEALKRQVVSLFSAALAGGQAQRAYLLKLEMPSESIFDGYDVVDNDHFKSLAEAARKSATRTRHRLGLPEHYFLANGRFIAKKNLFRLLEAFERYRSQAGPGAWHLVLLGDGELRPKLLDRLAQRGLQESVHLPGFRQYEELPAYYGLAEVFVHASTTEQWGLVVNEAMAASLPVLVSNRCGCAADLVVPGANGYQFDPCDTEELARLMLYVASAGCDRESLARTGCGMIAGWTTERFAQSLRRAAAAALAAPKCAGAADRLLLQMLILRRDSN